LSCAWAAVPKVTMPKATAASIVLRNFTLSSPDVGR
jgi:hypothetical protein